MRAVPRSRLDLIRLTNPGSSIETRDGAECVVIPTYDIDTDTQGETVLRIVDDVTSKPKPGDLLTNLKTGAQFKIVDPAALLPVRKGAKSEGDE